MSVMIMLIITNELGRVLKSFMKRLQKLGIGKRIVTIKMQPEYLGTCWNIEATSCYLILGECHHIFLM